MQTLFKHYKILNVHLKEFQNTNLLFTLRKLNLQVEDQYLSAQRQTKPLEC